ncbi:MAG: mechanosensitive ion channel domain-containing protein [Armatimonadota bacterium]
MPRPRLRKLGQAFLLTFAIILSGWLPVFAQGEGAGPPDDTPAASRARGERAEPSASERPAPPAERRPQREAPAAEASGREETPRPQRDARSDSEASADDRPRPAAPDADEAPETTEDEAAAEEPEAEVAAEEEQPDADAQDAEEAAAEEPAEAAAAEDTDAEEGATAPAAAPRRAADAEEREEADAAVARQAARQRRTEAISQSIERLGAADADEMSATQKAALVGQIAQGARVELGALREETAGARLTLERVQQMARDIKHDRQTVPRQVRTGQIPSLGASNRWDDLQETNAELQDIIDEAFSERLRLLTDIPEAEDALEQVHSLRTSSAQAFDPSLQSVLQDAEGYLEQRLTAMRGLLDLYNQQAAIATDAYDESSQYTEELSAAMVAARERGLLARSDAGLSLSTFRAIASSVAEMPSLGEAVISGYRENARPAHTMVGYTLRLAATALLLIALLVIWAKLPGWLTSVFTADRNNGPEHDAEGGEDIQELRQRRHAELVLPVARAALLAAVAAVGLQVWGLPQEWALAALSVLGTWAGYFALLAVMRQLLAPRHAELRVVPIDTEAAAAVYRLLRALALWSAIMLPIIWVLSVLEYQHEDVLVLLSVVHVVGLAIIAGWMIYATGGPARFMQGTEGRSAGPLQQIAGAAVPLILGLAAAIAILKAVGYVNLGGYLARILSLELPLVIIALVVDWQIRQHFATGSAWRKRLRAALWAAVAVAQIWVLGLRWHHWLAIIDFLKRPLFTVAENDVSIFSILRAVVVILIAWLVARFLRGWLARSARIRDRVSEGVQYALSSLTFYLILVAGVLWAMLVGGFPLNALTVLAGMAGIGLGFGLQDIVSNFVAGLILLLERPLAVGDYIEVAGTWGRVTSVSLRSTVVRTQDNVHILVPNADIISSQLTNLSHHDRTMRLVIPVGVGYDSDIDHVIEVLVDLAKEHPDVRDFPEPGARLASFGDSAIVVELLVWISDPARQVGAEVDLNLEIWRALKREGIEIPFPQQDIHIRDDSAALQIQHLPAMSTDEPTEA